MIVDSHTHYNHSSFKNSFRYPTRDENGHAIWLFRLPIPFYESCGFTRAFTIPNFFTDNYDHPIWECGVQLVDMVYLRMDL